jgi:RimJ/RimL family protein N-acetyltransferase
MRWVGDGSPISVAKCREWLGVTARNYKTRGYGMFALESKESGQVVGFCGLVHPGGQVEPEVKYAFLRSHWGAGLASEAIPALLAYGRSTHGLLAIGATVAPDNTASQRVLQRCGFVLVARRHNEDGSTTLVFQSSPPSEA